jgi:hypothetical protein
MSAISLTPANPGMALMARTRLPDYDVRPMSEQHETEKPAEPARPVAQPKEIGGPKGPEPTRYGDWEVNGRCTDF